MKQCFVLQNGKRLKVRFTAHGNKPFECPEVSSLEIRGDADEVQEEIFSLLVAALEGQFHLVGGRDEPIVAVVRLGGHQVEIRLGTLVHVSELMDDFRACESRLDAEAARIELVRHGVIVVSRDELQDIRLARDQSDGGLADCRRRLGISVQDGERISLGVAVVAQLVVRGEIIAAVGRHLACAAPSLQAVVEVVVLEMRQKIGVAVGVRQAVGAPLKHIMADDFAAPAGYLFVGVVEAPIADEAEAVELGMVRQIMVLHVKEIFEVDFRMPVDGEEGKLVEIGEDEPERPVRVGDEVIRAPRQAGQGVGDVRQGSLLGVEGLQVFLVGDVAVSTARVHETGQDLVVDARHEWRADIPVEQVLAQGILQLLQTNHGVQKPRRIVSHILVELNPLAGFDGKGAFWRVQTRHEVLDMFLPERLRGRWHTRVDALQAQRGGVGPQFLADAARSNCVEDAEDMLLVELKVATADAWHGRDIDARILVQYRHGADEEFPVDWRVKGDGVLTRLEPTLGLRARGIGSEQRVFVSAERHFRPGWRLQFEIDPGSARDGEGDSRRALERLRQQFRGQGV